MEEHKKTAEPGKAEPAPVAIAGEGAISCAMVPDTANMATANIANTIWAAEVPIGAIGTTIHRLTRPREERDGEIENRKVACCTKGAMLEFIGELGLLSELWCENLVRVAIFHFHAFWVTVCGHPRYLLFDSST